MWRYDSDRQAHLKYILKQPCSKSIGSIKFAGLKTKSVKFRGAIINNRDEFMTLLYYYHKQYCSNPAEMRVNFN